MMGSKPPPHERRHGEPLSRSNRTADVLGVMPLAYNREPSANLRQYGFVEMAGGTLLALWSHDEA